MSADLDTLETFTVYFSPRDYVGKYVVRRFLVKSGKEPLPMPSPEYIGPRLTEARATIPPGLTKINRDQSDDISVLETWV